MKRILKPEIKQMHRDCIHCEPCDKFSDYDGKPILGRCEYYNDFYYGKIMFLLSDKAVNSGMDCLCKNFKQNE